MREQSTLPSLIYSLFLFSSPYQFQLLGISFCDLSLYFLHFAINVHMSSSLSQNARMNNTGIAVGPACSQLAWSGYFKHFFSLLVSVWITFSPRFNCLLLSAQGQVFRGGRHLTHLSILYGTQATINTCMHPNIAHKLSNVSA